ncbi:MAG: hypothetical protein M1836_004441 [Candelina mexicana]|nr:MAG: hypothetical protein M1836_004441 [Candelina mexicana]
MAQVSLLPQQFESTRVDGDDAPGANLYLPSSAADSGSEAPLPNPPFVFPMRSSNSSPPTTSVPGWNAPARPYPSLGTKDGSVTKRTSRRSVNTLPKFDFHPANTHEPDTSRSPPHMPSPTTISGSGSAPMTIPSRSSGHRRGGSEFIGGDGTDGPAALISTSPTKSESAPPSTRLGPPAGRRGHAHRRSGAISCHDLSTIVKPIDPSSFTRGGSAPTTPLDIDSHRAFPPFDDAEVHQQSSIAANISPDTSPDSMDTPTSRRNTRQLRARVGFSDKIEFIERPLSTISSETSSSMTTIRCGHSLSGSISSVASASTASPPSTKSGRLSLSTTFENETSPTRPSTAGAVMAGSERRGINNGNDGDPLKRPMSAGGSSSTSTSTDALFSLISPPRKKHLFDPESYHVLSHHANWTIDKPGPSAETTAFPFVENHPSPRVKSMFEAPISSPSFKTAKKQKNVKTWAGSILSRKSRLRAIKQKTHGRRTPTPPLRSYTAPNHSSRSSFDFGADFTCSITKTPTANLNQTDFGLTPASLNRQRTLTDEDPAIMSSLIDLDAALGPFNTPSPGLDIDSGFGTGFATSKRRMHSSGTTGGFMGPGMHYHRRTESAPEMAAFDRGSPSLHRLGSNSTMADVFEEEEGEEEDGEVKVTRLNKDRDEEDVGTGIQVVDADTLKQGKGMDWTTDTQCIPRKVSEVVIGNEVNAAETSTKTTNSVTVPTERPILPEPALLEVVEENEAPRSSSITRSSDSSVTPTLPPVASEEKQRPPPIELGDPWLASPFALQRPTSSAISSPQHSPTYSPSTFESPQLATSASSFSDDYTYNSLLHGEPGPEIRMSVDDVPSLTSSNSTITSGGTSAGHSLSGGPYRTPGDRSGSISSAVSGRPRQLTNSKRASLVSLSRLVGGSGGERSKLNIEQKARPDSPEKPKEKKGKRLSRMMNFWKPKKDSKHPKVSDTSTPSEPAS